MKCRCGEVAVVALRLLMGHVGQKGILKVIHPEGACLACSKENHASYAAHRHFALALETLKDSKYSHRFEWQEPPVDHVRHENVFDCFCPGCWRPMMERDAVTVGSSDPVCPDCGQVVNAIEPPPTCLSRTCLAYGRWWNEWIAGPDLDTRLPKARDHEPAWKALS